MSKYEGHTPGPWEARNPIDGYVIATDRDANRGYIIAETDLGGPDYQANAKLIADAPLLAEQNDKMLAMLKRALPWMTDMLQEAKPDDRYIINDIYTYLQEIEGQQ